MTVSEKQLQANRENAQKGGVKTPEGKAIVKYNALKHGLLAKEVVITTGDGAENPEEFNALLEDLKTQLKPEGVLEEMLAEKIAVAYWRLRRACRYEVGLIRQKLDSATDNFYDGADLQGRKYHKTDEEINQEIEKEKDSTQAWEKDKQSFTAMHESGKSLEETYDWEDNWDWLYDKVCERLPEDETEGGLQGPQQLRETLRSRLDWSDDAIWEALIQVCEDRIECHKGQIHVLEKQKDKNKRKLQVFAKLGNIPSKQELDRLLRYEGAIERQFYKALNQLERIQRLRSGDAVPAPVEVDLNVSTG